MLKELAVERKNAEPLWNYRAVLETVIERAKMLREGGIENCCSGTIKLLSSWVDSLMANRDRITSEERNVAGLATRRRFLRKREPSSAEVR